MTFYTSVHIAAKAIPDAGGWRWRLVPDLALEAGARLGFWFFQTMHKPITKSNTMSPWASPEWFG
jgi:hypothetical protein